MKIETLREFCALATSLNFTTTARRFYISHSVLSRHISALEEELGCKLLIRTSHFVSLTPEGEVFLADARKVVKAHDDAIERMRYAASDKNRIIRIGYLYESVCDFLLPGCKRFRQRNPHCDLVFYSLNINDISEALMNDDIDVALGITLGGLDENTYSQQTLFKDNVQAIAPLASPFAKQGTLSVSDLEKARIIVRSLSLDVGPEESSSPLKSFFDENGLMDNVVERAADATALAIALQMDDSSVTIMPTHMVSFFGDKFTMLPVEGMDISMYLAAFWKKERENATLIELIGDLKDACDALRNP